MKKLLAIIGCWCAIGGFVLFFSSPNLVIAGTFKGGLDSTAGKTGHFSLAVPLTIGQIIGAFFVLLGVIFLGLIIYGGFIWMLARGNEQDITKARDLITSAIIGLIVILGAYAITVAVSVFV